MNIVPWPCLLRFRHTSIKNHYFLYKPVTIVKVLLLFLLFKLYTMKKIIILFVISVSCFFTSCNTATPENYFDAAVLNCNMMHGFATDGILRELESPSVKLVEGTKDKTEPMKRAEVIQSKIESLQPYYEKVKELKQTDETKGMLLASIGLYEYVLPVYKNEYMQLAKLYDDGAPKEQITALEQSIEQKYYPGFETLFVKLENEGKTYAAKNNINVKWDIQTSPQF